MNNKDKKKSKAFKILVALTALFTGLKLIGIVQFSWLLILLPLWGGIAGKYIKYLKANSKKTINSNKAGKDKAHSKQTLTNSKKLQKENGKMAIKNIKPVENAEMTENLKVSPVTETEVKENTTNNDKNDKANNTNENSKTNKVNFKLQIKNMNFSRSNNLGGLIKTIDVDLIKAVDNLIKATNNRLSKKDFLEILLQIKTEMQVPSNKNEKWQLNIKNVKALTSQKEKQVLNNKDVQIIEAVNDLIEFSNHALTKQDVINELNNISASKQKTYERGQARTRKL